jgi:acetolactate synthase-1/2/3 large subunit
MAGKPAFTLLHVGSGFANGIANIHNAGRANTTMVNIVGANATYHQANYPEHELINGRIVDLARVVSHWAHEAKSASDLGVLGALAARYARIGAGKICTVIAPTNCHWDPAVAPPEPAGPMETPKVSPQTIQDVVALLTNGKKTAIVLGSHALYGDGLELAGRIAAKTGADILGETTASRFARGEGRVPVQLIPYLPEEAVPFLKPYAQLILVGALFPVTTFAYKGMPVIKVPQAAKRRLWQPWTTTYWLRSRSRQSVGAPPQPAARRARSNGSPPAGVLTDAAIGQSLGILLPENAIVVSEHPTTDPAVYHWTEGSKNGVRGTEAYRF